jgi:ABC-type multidrug transport system ATPase subunit
VAASIQTSQLSKRFQYQWIFRDLELTLTDAHIWGIAGGNGSGKSTLVKILSGYLSPTLGKVSWLVDDKIISRDDLYRSVSWAAPYTGLIYEFTLTELFAFHTRYKPMRHGLSLQEFLEIIALPGHTSKPLQYFSSGMQQKIQLALAILSDTRFLLLDEPTSYLDQQAKGWFSNLLTTHLTNRLVVIASNDAFDLSFCTAQTDLAARRK